MSKKNKGSNKTSKNEISVKPESMGNNDNLEINEEFNRQTTDKLAESTPDEAANNGTDCDVDKSSNFEADDSASHQDKTDSISEINQDSNENNVDAENQGSVVELQLGSSAYDDNNSKTARLEDSNSADLVEENAVKSETLSAADISSSFAKTAPKLRAPSSKNSLTRSKLHLVSFWLSCVSFLLVGWISYTQFEYKNQWAEFEQQIKHDQSQHTEVIQDINRKVNLSTETVTKNQQKLIENQMRTTQLSDSLNYTQQRVKALSGRQKQDWLLAEAEYLIRLAELKITLEKDKVTAIALLNNADQRVLQTGDNQLLELRQSLANDITYLQTMIIPDLGGMVTELQSISNQIPRLSLISLDFEATEELFNKPMFENMEEKSWRAYYKRFLNDWVEIKNHSEPVKPLMTLNQRSTLNSNLFLAIQQAQVALIKYDQSLYQASLRKVSEWIVEFFKNDQIAKELLTKLNRLEKAKINPDFSQGLESISVILQVNKRKLEEWLGESPTTKSERSNGSNEASEDPKETDDSPQMTSDSEKGDATL